MRRTRQKADDGLRPEMRTHLRPFGLWVTTIETGLVTQGIPDFHYASNKRGFGMEGWCECKATKAFAVVIKPMQVGFHERRARYGLGSWIAIRRRTRGGKRQGAPVDELYLVPGCYVIELRDEGLDNGRSIFCGGGGPHKWDWNHVHALLTGPVVKRR